MPKKPTNLDLDVLLIDIESHLRTMAPHVYTRRTPQLLQALFNVVKGSKEYALVRTEMSPNIAIRLQGSEHPEDVRLCQEDWRERVKMMRVDPQKT